MRQPDEEAVVRARSVLCILAGLTWIVARHVRAEGLARNLPVVLPLPTQGQVVNLACRFVGTEADHAGAATGRGVAV